MNNEKCNKSIKKRMLWILLIVLIVVVSVLVVKLSVMAILHHNSIWMLCAEYEQYSNDFNLVKDYIATEFPEESDKLIIVSYNKNAENGLYDSDDMKLLTLPDEVALSLDTITRNGFHQDATLVAIRIYKGRITFRTMNGYALVYYPHEKPTWLHSPDEEISIKVREIKDGWYHVVKYNS